MNTQNQKYARNYQRPQINTTNLMKSFSTFEEGYEEVIKIIPEVKAYCGETILHDAVVSKMLDTIKDNIPSTNNTNYPNTFSFSIDSHEVGLKTDAGMAFGWRTIFDKESGKTIYKFRVTFIQLPTYRKAIVTIMKDSGWIVTENAIQNRFWNSVEGRRKNNHNTNGNQINTVKKEKEQVVEATDKVDIEVNPDMAEAFAKAQKAKADEVSEETEDPVEVDTKEEE